MNHLFYTFAELFLEISAEFFVEKIGDVLTRGFDYVSWRLFESCLDFLELGKDALLHEAIDFFTDPVNEVLAHCFKVVSSGAFELRFLDFIAGAGECT